MKVAAVFWRQINLASHRTLHGRYTGQYHITVPRSVDEPLRGFLGDLPPSPLTENGGFTINIPIAWGLCSAGSLRPAQPALPG